MTSSPRRRSRELYNPDSPRDQMQCLWLADVRNFTTSMIEHPIEVFGLDVHIHLVLPGLFFRIQGICTISVPRALEFTRKNKVTILPVFQGGELN